jgi:MFS family permease
MSGRRLILLAAAGSLCVTAGLAIAILLFSEFGETQARILGTTALIGLYGLLALPAGILIDQHRLHRLAAGVLALCAIGFAVALAALWTSDPPAALDNAVWTTGLFAAASTQTAALAARRTARDPAVVKRLFIASTALAVTIAAMLAGAMWAELEDETYFRFLGAIAVADVLAVALQPILYRLRGTEEPARHRLRLHLESGDTVDLEVTATGFTDALVQAVTIAERKGRVVGIERVLPTPAPAPVVADESRAASGVYTASV